MKRWNRPADQVWTYCHGELTWIPDMHKIRKGDIAYDTVTGERMRITVTRPKPRSASQQPLDE